MQLLRIELRIARITRRSVMKEMIFITPPHRASIASGADHEVMAGMIEGWSVPQIEMPAEDHVNVN